MCKSSSELSLTTVNPGNQREISSHLKYIMNRRMSKKKKKSVYIWGFYKARRAAFLLLYSKIFVEYIYPAPVSKIMANFRLFFF